MFDVQAEFIRRLPDFYKKHPIISQWVISFGRYLWSEKQFHEFGLKNAQKNALELIDAGFETINFDFSVSSNDIEKIPAIGRLVIVANHPLFALDGLGLIKILSQKRKDLKILVGGTFAAFEHLSIVVDDTLGTISKDVTMEMNRHLDEEGALIIFPSGQLSRFINGKVQDPQWHSSFFKMALKKNAPILPIFIDAKNSPFYYFLAIVCLPFSRVWVIRQMFYQRNKRPKLTIGDVISANDIDEKYGKMKDNVQAVRDIVYSLGGK